MLVFEIRIVFLYIALFMTVRNDFDVFVQETV